MSPPRIVIADDHQMLAEGLRSLLEPEFVIVDVVTDGRELVAAARRHQPDVVIADVTMPLLNGIEATAQMREAGVSAKVIILTMHREIAYARRALEAGAAGYVLKVCAATELVAAVREALRGRTYVTPLIAGELIQSYQTDDSRSYDPAHRLTARQFEVLQLIAEGRSAKEVAGVLKISTRTAEVHRARILETLGLRSTADLVHYAIRNGIISA